MNFKYYNHLGFHNPYYFTQEDEIIIESDFDTVISKLPLKRRVLDFTSLVEVFSTGYCFGDRTLIKGLQKSPWMAKPNLENNGWEYFKVPDHSEIVDSEEKIALRLYDLLERELLNYVNESENIGILLTGGMDSRIVASVLNNLLETGKISGRKVYAYTWGHEESRDVVYAKRIADLYGWSWKHLIVDEIQMLENCEVALANGCEFSPIHLHAMPQVARETHLDCILAGSFGDSVGRAEFSGKKVRDLTGLQNLIRNIGGMLREDFYNLTGDNIILDIEHYHKLFPQLMMYQQYEQDQQLHYMRRMLNACMSVIDKKIPLFQMFSSPPVFGYIWSLSPDVRNDNIYYNLLKNKSPELLELPWARTGLIYPTKIGQSDHFSKKHHDYGKMIRECYLEKVNSSIQADRNLSELIFNVKCVNGLIRNLSHFPIKGGILFEDRLLYAGQILDFIRLHDLVIDLPKKKDSLFAPLKEDLKYKMKFLYKKVR